MELLTKKQKEILNCLDKVSLSWMAKDVFLKNLGDKPEFILADVKLLKDKDFIDVLYGLGDEFPAQLKITPKGKEKLKENFFVRLKESAYNNPWAVVSIILALIFGTTSLLNYFPSIYFQLTGNPWVFSSSTGCSVKILDKHKLNEFLTAKCNALSNYDKSTLSEDEISQFITPPKNAVAGIRMEKQSFDECRTFLICNYSISIGDTTKTIDSVYFCVTRVNGTTQCFSS